MTGLDSTATLAGKHILLVVSGGVAAYKSPDVVRRMRDAGALVRVAMTPAATAFITPLTLQAVSGEEVRTALFDTAAEAAMGHIELARWADAIVVAPATADFIARLRLGRADDLATAVCLASTAPLLIAPAMNQQMWAHPATQDNLAVLASRGVRCAGPGDGSQACGEVGPGRMLEAPEICRHAQALFAHGALAGQRVLVTAGPTREALDPVRYISNRSSGKMGYAIAQAASEAGAEVTLVSGPTRLAPPPGVIFVSVDTALAMHAEVMARVMQAGIFIATAAVADYRPAQAAPAKLKRDGQPMTLTLVPNPDILAEVARLPAAPYTVGFAAETNEVLRHARGKLAAKGIDLIAANQVGAELGFDSEDNELTVLWADGEQHLPRASKYQLARALIALIATRLSTTPARRGPT
jgi:phosphopantothenoylcysteine decarboxylase / phosphopantothenate---cysteine ligase